MLLFMGCSENNVDKNNEQNHVEASSPETDIKNEDKKEENNSVYATIKNPS